MAETKNDINVHVGHDYELMALLNMHIRKQEMNIITDYMKMNYEY